MMGGDINVDSTENRGSRFRIILPHVAVAEAAAAAETGEIFNAEELVFKEATVLIADDVATNRLLIKEFLRTTSIASLEAENGEDVVRLSLQYKPDVILMDLRMPVLSGLGALKQIGLHEDTRSIPVIALTASGMEGDRERMLDQGFSGYLTKPIRKATLFLELSRFIPFTKKAGPAPSEPPADAPEEADLEHLPRVIEILENEYMRIWTQTRKNRFFDAIEEFASRISRLGADHGFPTLKTYGEELHAHAAGFDVEKMNAALDAYPKMIETLRSLRAQKAKDEVHGDPDQPPV